MAGNNIEEVALKIKQARVKLLFNSPFFGNLAMQLKMVDATDLGWCPTAATDGRCIYFNRDFFADMTIDETAFVICHEILHCALGHFGRRNRRDPQWWNMANDYVINGMLVRDNIGKMPTKPVTDKAVNGEKGETAQRVGLYNEKYVGWSSEAVYDDLEKRKVKKEMTLDVHLEMGDDQKPGDKKMQGPGGTQIEVNSEDLKKIQNELKAKVIQAAQAAKAAGKLPASLQRLIDDLTENKINWRDLLRQNIQSCLTDDFTWMRPNRRYMNGGIFLPSLDKDEKVSVEIAIDMSGSISDAMAKDFLSEVHGIISSYHDFEIGIVCFDTQTYNYQKFTSENADDLMNYECKGGGGTDFMAFWNFWIRNEIEPKKAVIFTDGFCFGSWGPPNYCDTLWIITEGAKTRVVPEFGDYAYYDSQAGVEELGSI